ncbi:MAG: DCC1-like thiol-disulfide oxidoreductase family protein [Pseudomonadota bacterium]
MSSETTKLVYDRECPACDFYCRRVELREDAGDLEIVDAREHSDVLDEITARGLDIDEGMVLKVGDELHYGSDAIHVLARLSNRSGVFNRFNYWLFRSRAVSNVLYPLLRFLRGLMLKALGRTRINNLDMPGNDRF